MKPLTFLAAAAVGLTATIASAQDGPSAEQKARQGMMRIVALNMGVLGGMAKGEIPFDAAQAGTAADTLAAVAMIDQGLLWPEGSGNDMAKTTGALPAIWMKPAEFAAAWAAFGESTKGLQAAAAEGRAALAPAMGKAGGSCKGCHDDFREAQN